MTGLLHSRSRLRTSLRPIRPLSARAALLSSLFAIGACAAQAPVAPTAAISTGEHYVAMGSSFAAGPGIGEMVPDAPKRCGRSQQNYAHQLAQLRGFHLTDVSCSGATTEHILAPWAELPAQLDAVTEQTALVTVTIGGNDLDYMGSLFRAYCRADPATAKPDCNPPPPPDEAAYAKVVDSLRAIARQVRSRAPGARLIFVDYLTVLPEGSTCALTPLNDQDADNSRTIARRLAAITAQVAQETGNEVLAASALSRDHDACSQDPWMTGWANPGSFGPRPGEPVIVPYHPNLAGMTVIAQALDERLSR